MRRPFQKSNQPEPNRFRNRMRQGLLIWLVAGMLVVVGLLMIPLDKTFADPTNLDHLPGDLTRIVTLSEIFAHGYGVLLIGVAIWFLASHKRRFIPRIFLCAFWPAAGVSLLKLFFGRLRPNSYFDDLEMARYPESIYATWMGWLPNGNLNMNYAMQSFASAHTATTWGLAIGMSFVFPKGRWMFWGVATLASIQRITSFAHWTSDVFFGAAIAVVMAGSLFQNWGLGYLLLQFENRKSDFSPAIGVALAADDEANSEKDAKRAA